MEGKARRGDERVHSNTTGSLGRRQEEEVNNDSSKPRNVHHKSKWKVSEDAVYWIHLARAQEKKLKFWQTRSRAIVVHDSVPADCIEKVVSENADKTLCQRLSTPSARSENNSRKCQDIEGHGEPAAAGATAAQQRSTGKLGAEEENHSKLISESEESPQVAVLEDQE